MKRFLVVVDMQKDFVDGSLGTKEAQAIVPNVCKKIESFEDTIIVTMDTHGKDYMNTREGRFLPVEHCIKDTEGWKLDKAVEEALAKKPHTVLEKPTFGSTRLPDLLEVMATGQSFEVCFIGLCTDICVVSNVLLTKAAFPETDIYVDASCCAGVTPEKHLAALETMKSCQIVIENEE